ncbi:MAG: NAD(P)H-dependent oxidoreductase [Candidatus Campbellbacteria bacterium]|nr:NAD(P)H-dependent oxidoreductase [Candidatus Campbellbacteria bacterium]
MINIKIIAGSSRPGRFNIQPANWIFELANNRESVNAELLDLKEIDLPFLDEEKSPMSGEYSKEHTLEWSEKIKEADGFVFVTPEYNHSFSPVLKNAIDFLYNEWNYKPASFISYGSLAGGARAVEHLRGVAGEIKMYDLRDQILIPNYWNGLNESGEYQFNENQEQEAEALLDNLVFWADKMKDIRAELN